MFKKALGYTYQIRIYEFHKLHPNLRRGLAIIFSGGADPEWYHVENKIFWKRIIKKSLKS